MMRALAALIVCTVALTAAPALAQQPIPLEQRKLELDARKLEQDTGWERWARSPLGSVLVAALVGLEGVRRYRQDVRRDRRLRIEEGVQKSLERLVEAPREELTASAQAVAALNVLAGLTERNDGREHTSRVTGTLWTMIQDDLVQLDTLTRASMPIHALREWGPYAERLGKDDAARACILERYLAALKDLHQQHAIYLSDVQLREDGRYVSSQTAPAAGVRRYFERLVEGYRLHLPGDAAGHRQAIESFGSGLNNARLAQQALAQP
jgi:hypothetical protein